MILNIDQWVPVLMDLCLMGACWSHLFQRCHRHPGRYRHNDVPLRHVERDLTEDHGDQVRFDRDEDHVGAADHLQVGVSGVNPQLLQAKGGALPGWMLIQNLDVEPSGPSSYLEATQVPGRRSAHLDIGRKNIS